jgi:hypothetical protein
MLVIISDRGISQWHQGIPRKIGILSIVVAIQHLHDDFQSTLDVISHPLALQVLKLVARLQKTN